MLQSRHLTLPTLQTGLIQPLVYRSKCGAASVFAEGWSCGIAGRFSVGRAAIHSPSTGLSLGNHPAWLQTGPAKGHSPPDDQQLDTELHRSQQGIRDQIKTHLRDTTSGVAEAAPAPVSQDTLERHRPALDMPRNAHCLDVQLCNNPDSSFSNL